MFTPVRNTMLQLLAEQTQYVIPHFQRGYSWGKDNAQELLEDLVNSSDPNSAPLFLGTLILLKGNAFEHGIQTQVVDGQQRLTTIMLLLAACRLRAQELGDPRLPQTTLERMSYVNAATGEAMCPKLVPSHVIQRVFAHVTSETWDGNLPSMLGRKGVKTESNKLRPVLTVFMRHLAQCDLAAVKALLDSLYKSCLITIQIENEVDALNIFERTNARGMELEISDLLKNHLFSKDVKNLEESWKAITTNASGTLLRMLKYYYVSSKGYTQKSVLYRQLRLLVHAIGADRLTNELLAFSEYYRCYREPSLERLRGVLHDLGLSHISEHEERRSRLLRSLEALREFGVTQAAPTIYAAAQCVSKLSGNDKATASDALLRLVESIERLHFVNNAVCDRVGNEVERLYADSCVDFVVTQEPLKAFQKLIGALRSTLASEDEFVDRFCDITYSKSTLSLISYVFDRFNNHNLSGSQRLVIYNPDPDLLKRNNNIEHFQPQNPRDGETPSKATMEAINNIGNLLAVSYITNSRLGNASPAEKTAMLQGKLANEIQSSVLLRQFLDTYGPKASHWDHTAIEARAKDMALRAYREVWRIN